MSDYERIAAGPHPDDDRVRRVRLDNAERSNVIDLRLLLELQDAVEAADRDDATQAVLLGTTADDFCSGADLAELSELDFEAGSRWMTAYFETLAMLRETGKPVVAAVEGTCVAGGNELVMACDLVVAGASARFGQPEVGVGSTAAGGGVQLLPLVVGEKRARELLLTGRLLEADEAERFGLVNRVVDDGEADAAALSLLVDVVEHSSPQAYRAIKAMLAPWTNLATLHREVARDVTASVWASEEFRERAGAFLAGEELAERSFSGVRPPEREEE